MQTSVTICARGYLNVHVGVETAQMTTCRGRGRAWSAIRVEGSAGEGGSSHLFSRLVAVTASKYARPRRGKGSRGGNPSLACYNVLGTRAAHGSSLSCTGKHACASACSNMPRCSRARMLKPFQTPQDTCGYMKRAKRALDVSAISRLPAPRTARSGPVRQHAVWGPAHAISGHYAGKAANTQVCYTARTAPTARRNASYATT